MNAGHTELTVNTRIRITHVGDAEDRHLVGMTGNITHPFPGHMVGSSKKYIAGVYVDPEAAAGKINPDPLGVYCVNLMTGDRFEVINEEAVQ